MPVKGTLKISRELFFFEPASGSPAVTMSYGEIEDIEKILSKTRVIIKGSDNNCATRMISFTGKHCKKLIMKYKGDTLTNPFVKTAFRFKHAPLILRSMFFLLALPAAAVVVYGILFESYRLVPVSFDKKLSKLIEGKITSECKPYNDKKLNSVIERIRKRLSPKQSIYAYSIKVIKDDRINAFTLPDGKIFVFSGLINKSTSPEELAGVIAHEISHVENRHGIRQLIRLLSLSVFLHLMIGAGFEELESAELISEITGLLIFMKYSREFEEQADVQGAALMMKSRMSCRGLMQLFNTMKREANVPAVAAFFDSHPDIDNRIKFLKDHVSREKFKPQPLLFKNEHWTRIKKIKK